MAKDFRSDRIRTKAIVGTGSISNTKPYLGLLIYSSSIAADWRGNVTDSAILSNVGNDVWMFISGSTNTGLTRAAGSSVLFGGDVVVSGTLWAERSVIEVDDTVIGNFRAPNKLIQGYTTDASTGRALFLADPFTTSGGPNGNGTISFKVVDGVAGAFDYPATQNTDVFFHVSGSRGVKGSTDRGLALFDGDVFVSGNLELSPESSFVLGGDLTVATLTLTSNTIKNSESENTLLLTTDQDIQSVAGMKIGNDALTGSDDTTHIFLSGSGDVGIEGTLQISGREIKDAYGNAVLRFDENNPYLYGTVFITGSTGGVDKAGLRVYGSNAQGDLILNRVTTNTLTNDYLGVVQFWSDDGGAFNTPSAYVGAKATADWDVGSGGSVADTAIEFWTRGTSDSAILERVAIENNSNVSDRIQLTVSGNLKLADGTAPGGGSFGSNVLSADDVAAFRVLDNGTVQFLQDVIADNDVYIGGNLDVNGTLTTIDTTNLKVSDALVELASVGGGGSNNSNGGIAIASGSSIDDVSLVFGRGNVNNTWRAGRKDTQEGTVTDVSDSVLVDIQTAGIRFDHGLYLTGSFGGSANHLTASSVDGGILLNANLAYGVTVDSKLNLTNAVKEIEADGENWLYQDSTQSRVYSPTGKVDVRSNASGDASAAETRITLTAETYAIGTSARGTTPTEGYKLYLSGSPEIELSTKPPDDSYLSLMPTQRIVLSGSTAEADGGPVIILSSSQEYNGGLGNGFEGFISIGATQTEVDRDFTLSRHRDVRTLLSGAVGTAGSNTRGVTLVSGDLVVSGNTDFKGSVAIGSIATGNLTLTSVGSDEPYLRFRNSDVQINRRTSDDAMVFIDGDLGTSKTLRDLASLSVTDNTDVFTISGGEPSYIKTTGSFSFDTDDRYTTAIADDTFFFVSGSIGSKYRSVSEPGNGDRGTTLIGGDLHVSGAITADVPQFFTNLGLAYRIPDTSGQTFNFSDLSFGAGAVIDTNGSGIPLQLRNPNSGDEALLTITGSLGFQYSGGGNNARLHMQSNNDFEFHNSAGEVFRMLAGGSGQHIQTVQNGQIRFTDSSRFIKGLTEDSVKKLRIENTSTGGTVQVSTTAGRMEVTGSLYPGADNTYDLGSNDYRWANIYTGDLHLQNERGDWTVIEEEDFLTLRNNKNGKRYKLLMELMDEE